MKIFEPTLFLRDGKEWIKGFTMERPNLDYCKSLSDFEFEFAKWQQSAVEYPVCEGSIPEILLSIDKVRQWPNGVKQVQLLHNGIRIDELADRLEVVDDEYDPPGYFGDKFHYRKVIRLRPEVKEIEDQKALWNEAMSLFANSNINHVLERFELKRVR